MARKVADARRSFGHAVGFPCQHEVEIRWPAFCRFGLVRYASVGELLDVANAERPDYVYYSAMLYTTVGFGDTHPSGSIAFMSGMPALAMITYAASSTFLEMRRDWPGRVHRS